MNAGGIKDMPRIANNNIVVRVTDDIKFLAEEAARAHNMNLSDYVRSKIIEALEDEYDLKAYAKAYSEYQKDPDLYTFEEAERILNGGEEI